MLADHLGELVAHGVYRVEGGHGLLEDEGDPRAAHGLHLGGLGVILQDIFPVQPHLAAQDLARRGLDQLYHGHLGDGLAAAGLAYNGDDLLLVHIEGDAVHRLDLAGHGEERGFQVLNLKQLLSHYSFPLSLGSNASRRPSPIIFSVIISSISATPGTMAGSGLNISTV